MTRRILLLIPLAALVAATGCSQRGVSVSGKVTKQGQPVSFAIIRFTPDLAKKGSGPTATMRVINGEFSSDGPDTVAFASPGPQLVNILTPPPDGKEGPDTEYQLAVDIPSGGALDLHFDVGESQRRK